MCMDVCLCALYRERDGIIAKNQIENNSKKSNIDIDLNKDVNEYYYHRVWNGVAAAPHSMLCIRSRIRTVCVYLYIYICTADCSIYFNVYIMHIKNNAMPSILIKIKENLFTETNDLLAEMKDGSVAEKESESAWASIIPELTHFNVDFPIYTVQCVWYALYMAFILVTFDFFCVACNTSPMYMWACTHERECMCMCVPIYSTHQWLWLCCLFVVFLPYLLSKQLSFNLC